MNNHQIVPMFMELMNEEAAVISGGSGLPIFQIINGVPTIINADGNGQEVTITPRPNPSSPPPPNNGVGSQLWLPATSGGGLAL